MWCLDRADSLKLDTEHVVVLNFVKKLWKIKRIANRLPKRSPFVNQLKCLFSSFQLYSKKVKCFFDDISFAQEHCKFLKQVWRITLYLVVDELHTLVTSLWWIAWIGWNLDELRLMPLQNLCNFQKQALQWETKAACINCFHLDTFQFVKIWPSCDENITPRIDLMIIILKLYDFGPLDDLALVLSFLDLWTPLPQFWANYCKITMGLYKISPPCS